MSGFVRLLPAKAGRVVYGILYFAAAIYAAVETGYFYLFSEMMWLSDFRYASEGSDYFSVLLSYPIGWWLGLAALTVQGVVILANFPRMEAEMVNRHRGCGGCRCRVGRRGLPAPGGVFAGRRYPVRFL